MSTAVLVSVILLRATILYAVIAESLVNTIGIVFESIEIKMLFPLMLESAVLVAH